MTNHRPRRSRALFRAGGPVLAALLVACAANPQPGRIQVGGTYTGDATFYTLTSMGNCSYPELTQSSRLFAAMNQADYENARMCGASVVIQRGNRTVTVRVIDRCPECKPGDIDLSPDAFAAIAQPVEGRVQISWHLGAAPVTGPVQYRVKTGSSAYWIGIQPLNHPWPVQKLEVQSGNSWLTLDRKDYNYFLAEGGLGAGPFTVRMTDITGRVVTSTGIKLMPDAVQTPAGQTG